MPKIVTVVGARPQFIKVAPVSRELRRFHQEVLVHTGQHYDYLMSEVFFVELGLPRPDYHLGVGSGSHGRQTAGMLTALEDVFLKEKPDWVLVYGDTNSTLAGAIAAVKLHIPVAHVEAGLRSFNRRMPEEINRIVVDHIANILFCPTENAVAMLAREGVTEGVHFVGDVMYDAILSFTPKADQSDILTRLGIEPGKYWLATVHRPENTDRPQRLESILGTLSELGIPVILPLHPRTAKKIIEFSLTSLLKNLGVIEPVSYIEMIALEKNACGILTDSGGMQKEAYILGVPCITLRDETEWVETVKSGWNMLVGANPELIKQAVRQFHPRGPRPAVFGRGKAGLEIAKLLLGDDYAT